MSLFSNPSLTCDACGHVYTVAAVESVNADRRPDLRRAILDDNFQDMTCPACGANTRLEPMFSYLDSVHGHWLACLPARRTPQYRAVEAEATELFDRTYGVKASRAARDAGAGLVPRVTFGWPAVREKLLISELELSDVVVEMMKLDLLRRLPEAPLGPAVELRLVGVEEERMRLRWVNAETEATLSQFSVGRELYDVISADQDGWSDVRAMLTNGPFVDMQKAYLTGDAPATL